jgi:hypothetical protein
MGNLGGLAFKTLITQLEVTSDDSTKVLVISRGPEFTTLSIREPWERDWESSGPKFSVTNEDIQMVIAAISGEDSQWRLKYNQVTATRFAYDNPAPKADEEAQRCAQLDIERARAANVAEERELLRAKLAYDHSHDLHVTRDEDNCPTCEAKHPVQKLTGEDPFAAALDEGVRDE